MHRKFSSVVIALFSFFLFFVSQSDAQEKDFPNNAANNNSTLEQQIQSENAVELTREAEKFGSATRGAILFYQPVMTCTKCHSVGEELNTLGPNLAEWKEPPKAGQIVEALLHPSKKIRKGYEAVTVVTEDGRTFTGLIHKEEAGQLVLRDSSRDGKEIVIPKKEIDLRKKSGSIMPQGLVNQLNNRQQFLDLVKYLLEVSQKGANRALALKPPASLFALPPVAEYEKRIDHTGLISSWNRKSFERGKAIYDRLCVNCHGTKNRVGSLPTSLKFASGKFKNGSDPYSMYQTLTHGFGMMVPQRWMVPEQKYDVIHYIREAYLKPFNHSQFKDLDAEYLARLPKGNTRGPKPSPYSPWENMNYGPSLIYTYEAGHDGSNIAYKGIAVRLDRGPGGLSRGKHWMIFDHDTLRVSAAWSGNRFIDYHSIMFNGQHNIHPRLTGEIAYANPTAPGWANPETGSFEDPRLRGRDGKPYGPLPREWAHYKGLYHYGNRVVISYSVGKTDLLEMPGISTIGSQTVFTRTFNIGPREKEMILQVAKNEKSSQFVKIEPNGNLSSAVVAFGPKPTLKPTAKPNSHTVKFNGKTHLKIARSKEFDFTNHDYSVFVRFRTKKGGTLIAKTRPKGNWVPDGKALFVRGGRVVFDIGWVGAVTSKKRVNDGKWHDLVMTWTKNSGEVRLYIDGKLDRRGNLKPKKPVKGHEVHIGFCAPNFPRQQSYFDGEIHEIGFYRSLISQQRIGQIEKNGESPRIGLVGNWFPVQVKKNSLEDRSGRNHTATLVHGDSPNRPQKPGILVVGLSQKIEGARWINTGKGNLRLVIPAGKEALRFTLSLISVTDRKAATKLATAISKTENTIDLAEFTKGGPARWPERISTKTVTRKNGGPFEVDVLTRPVANPWSCRVRFTGLDFAPKGKTMAICTWDGDVWLVKGWARPSDVDPAGSIPQTLTWQRIASGLFQPLGLLYVDGKIYVSCRDQIAILHDLNGDGEIDFYQNFNNDHQVTEHFHEFAMGLQRDDEGNFYYAKSARHALPAIVPHHGTLLKVSRDGAKTEIIATGFRAANGVCLNPDGTFFVTDQEGHWTPKNRINWVKKGGFYGNMLGYHNVTDTSDSAMEQPLCWITNSFDRSPAELLWVKDAKWGPLNGSLLSFSYGYGKVFVVLHEKIGDGMQGGMCELPLPQFPTGLIRGRFHKTDGQLYTCGMFAWAGNQQQPGGLYRIRYTGKAMNLPLKLKATAHKLSLTFSEEMSRESVSNLKNYAIKVWDLKRTKNYGSKHYNERYWAVEKTTLSQDGKTIEITIPQLAPTWCMEILYKIRNKTGEEVRGKIHNTIHEIGK